jgi:hypothetical protein
MERRDSYGSFPLMTALLIATALAAINEGK